MKKIITDGHLIVLFSFFWSSVIVGFLKNKSNVLLFNENERMAVFWLSFIIFSIASSFYANYLNNHKND